MLCGPWLARGLGSLRSGKVCSLLQVVKFKPVVARESLRPNGARRSLEMQPASQLQP